MDSRRKILLLEEEKMSIFPWKYGCKAIAFLAMTAILLTGCRSIDPVVSMPAVSSEEYHSDISSAATTTSVESVMPSESENSSADQSSAVSSAASNSPSSKGSSSSAVSSKPKVSSAAASSQAPQTPSYPTVEVKGEIKAVWLSQFDLKNVLMDGKIQRNQAEFTELFRKMLNNLQSCGFNTLFIQARPYSDSFYPSEYFPWSEMVTGSYSSPATYDPFSIMVSEAKKAKFSVHGWLNPLRGMKEEQIKQVDDRYPIKKWYNDPQKRGVNIGLSSDGTNMRWYYNPAIPEVRQLIADGAKEILKKYNLDGIHIDDYFYNAGMTFDAKQYQAYQKSGGKLSLGEWRQEQTSALVKELYQAVKSVNSKALFGVSPAGNVSLNYGTLSADVKLWCREKGYIDYICPQIYFGFEHQIVPFAETVALWNGFITKESGVFLLGGLTLDKAGKVDSGAKSGKNEWVEHHDILGRSILETRKQSHAKGIVLFSYQHLFDPVTGAVPEQTKKEINNMLPILKQ